MIETPLDHGFKTLEAKLDTDVLIISHSHLKDFEPSKVSGIKMAKKKARDPNRYRGISIMSCWTNVSVL